jgi:hypothetical protein
MTLLEGHSSDRITFSKEIAIIKLKNTHIKPTARNIFE